MVRILGNITIFLLFLGVNIYGSSLEVSLSDKEIVVGESVFLTIATVEEGNQSSFPPIKSVAGVKIDEVIRTSTINYVLINGKNRAEHIQTMTLEFRPKKSITIPAFSFTLDGEESYSKEQYLKVVSSKDELTEKNRDFSIEMKLSKNEIYKDESVLLTVLFRHKKDIDLQKMEYEKPKFIDFFAKHIGKEKIYQEGKFIVYKLNYMLTPKHSGVLTISPANIKIAIQNRQLQKEGWYRDILSWHRVISNGLKLRVEKLDESYEIVGDFKLKSTIDSTTTEPNRPINLTIELFGEGNLEAYRGIEFDIPNVTIYSDDSNTSSQLDSAGVKSFYKKSFVFIATDNFVIPSKTIRIFNPKNKSVKILKTEAYRVKINKNIEKKRSIDKKILYYLPFLIAFVFGIILTLLVQNIILLYKKYRAKKVGFEGHKALQILYPYSSENIEIEEMVRKLYAIKNGEKDIKIDKKKLNKMLEEYSSKGE